MLFDAIHKLLLINSRIFLLFLSMLLHFYTAMATLYLYIMAILTPGVLQITLCSVLRTCIPELCKAPMHCYTTRGVNKGISSTQRDHNEEKIQFCEVFL